MENDKYKLICNKCDYIWEQEVYGLGDVDWNCPKCKVADTAMLEYTPGDTGFYNRETKMGGGGALHA